MKMVKMSTAGERINHWVLMLSFFALALTGFGFAFDSLNWLNIVFGGNHIAKDIHKWGGLVFFLSLLYTIGAYLGESLKFSSDDAEWLRSMGGYLSGEQVPPVGRLNAGQKLFYLSVLVLGLAIGISGFVIWLAGGNRSAMQVGFLVHNLAFVVYMTTVPFHIYMATAANPGTFRVMTRGTVPLGWAKKTHGKWVKDMGLE
jgi:formate dehydrogenase subunit gamma